MYDDEFGWYWTSDYYDYGVALGFNNLNPQPLSLNSERAGIFRMSKQHRDQGSYIRNAGLPIRPVIKVEGREIVVPESVASKTLRVRPNTFVPDVIDYISNSVVHS